MAEGGLNEWDTNIHNEPCACPKGQCAHFLENDADCINRLPNASVMACKDCLSMTWHSDGKCLRCKQLGTFSSPDSGEIQAESSREAMIEALTTLELEPDELLHTIHAHIGRPRKNDMSGGE